MDQNIINLYDRFTHGGMNRREFLETVTAAAVLPAFGQASPVNEWGSAVFDLHFHLRQQPAGNIAHLDGAPDD